MVRRSNIMRPSGQIALTRPDPLVPLNVGVDGALGGTVIEGADSFGRRRSSKRNQEQGEPETSRQRGVIEAMRGRIGKVKGAF